MTSAPTSATIIHYAVLAIGSPGLSSLMAGLVPPGPGLVPRLVPGITGIPGIPGISGTRISGTGISNTRNPITRKSWK